MKRFEDKVVMITGAARGQGAEQARQFANEGARVVLTDLDKRHLGEAVPSGAACLHLALDVSSEEAWTQAVSEALAAFGALDVLINNAGIFIPRSLQETDAELMDRHYRTNQLGVFLGMRAVSGPMIEAGRGGAIVNTSSVGGTGGYPGIFAYSATKWAVRGMTKSAAADLAAHRIRVNSIHPGVIDTPMLGANPPEVMDAYLKGIPLQRMGTTADVARLVLFLASDEAAFITGAEVTIDGGASL